MFGTVSGDAEVRGLHGLEMALPGFFPGFAPALRDGIAQEDDGIAVSAGLHVEVPVALGPLGILGTAAIRGRSDFIDGTLLHGRGRGGFPVPWRLLREGV